MSVTYGFYNSKNHDRRYDALQMSSIFDGIIEDGIFMSIGNQFNVSADSGMWITVDTGRAWFNHTWTLNDALLPLEVPVSEIILDRIDAVVLEINANDAVRENSIKIIKGTPSSSPVRPTMAHTATLNQHPLAFIYVAAAVNDIYQSDITNMVGTSTTPFVTGVVSSMDIDAIVAQWQNQFERWFDNLQVILDGDVAARLAGQIMELQERWMILAKDHVVYTDIEDGNYDPLLDNNGEQIGGKTVFVVKGGTLG